ncbi:hypothetical protein ABPG77_006176 [Micractinium sp. CCAP 211/92]
MTPLVHFSILQCEATFLAVVGSFLASELPKLVPHDAAVAAAAAAAAETTPIGRTGDAASAGSEAAPQLNRRLLQRLQSFVYELESSLLLAYIFLLRQQPFYARVATGIVSQYAGWEWELDSVPNSGPWPCWEQVALLRASKPKAGIGADHSINYILNFGQLRPRWQLFLDAFFRHSDEHSRPWTVEGNLQPLPEQSSPNRSTAVLWVLPARGFKDSGYLDRPASPDWLRFEGAGFVAAGFVWYPQIVAEGKQVKVGVRLWPGALPAAGERRLFSVSFAAVHASSNTSGLIGQQDFFVGFDCDWPESFDPYHTCSLPAALPLHGMLTQRLPGFVPEGELLFRVSVAATTAGSGQGEPGPGPMGGTPRLFSSPLLRLGYLAAERQLWGQHGFPSKRLPSSSAAAAATALVAAQHAARAGMEGWEEDAYRAMQAGLDRRDRRSIWQVVRLLFDTMESQYGVWHRSRTTMLGRHAASAVVALAVAALPITGWRAWKAVRRRQAARRRQQHPASQQIAPPPAPRRRPKQQRQQHDHKRVAGTTPVAPASFRLGSSFPFALQAEAEAAAPHGSNELYPRQLQHTAASSPERPSSSQSGAGPSAPTDLLEAPATAGQTGEHRRLRRRKRRSGKGGDGVEQQQQQEEEEHKQQALPAAAAPRLPILSQAHVELEDWERQEEPPQQQEQSPTLQPAAEVGISEATVPQQGAELDLLLSFILHQDGDAATGAVTPPAAAEQGAARLATAAASGAASGPPAALTAASDDDDCVVCLEQRRCVCCVPCGHLLLCRPCADCLMATPAPLCPLCREPVALAQRVWT